MKYFKSDTASLLMLSLFSKAIGKWFFFTIAPLPLWPRSQLSTFTFLSLNSNCCGTLYSHKQSSEKSYCPFYGKWWSDIMSGKTALNVFGLPPIDIEVHNSKEKWEVFNNRGKCIWIHSKKIPMVGFKQKFSNICSLCTFLQILFRTIFSLFY